MDDLFVHIQTLDKQPDTDASAYHMQARTYGRGKIDGKTRMVVTPDRLPSLCTLVDEDFPSFRLQTSALVEAGEINSYKRTVGPALT
jgi:hypothetical protein